MPDEKPSLAGCFLISNSTIQDPNFTNTVVLIIDHDENGAFGLIVNRPGDSTLFDVLDGVDEAAKGTNLFQGGPVRPDALFILHGNAEAAEAGDEVIDGVYMSSSRSLLDQLVDSETDFHVYNGYSGWGPGQLESEIKMKTWVTMPARADVVFHKNPDVVWREALANKGGLYSYFAQKVRDPFMN